MNQDLGKTIILTEDSQIKYYDLFEILAEVFKPEEEQDYEDQINF
jgi:hypothetical protein